MYCLFASFTCPLLRVKHLPTSHFDFDRNPLKAAASIYLQCLQQFKVLVCRVVEETCTDLSTCANSAAPTVTPCGLRILPSASSSSTWNTCINKFRSCVGAWIRKALPWPLPFLCLNVLLSADMRPTRHAGCCAGELQWRLACHTALDCPLRLSADRGQHEGMCHNSA